MHQVQEGVQGPHNTKPSQHGTGGTGFTALKQLNKADKEEEQPQEGIQPEDFSEREHLQTKVKGVILGAGSLEDTPQGTSKVINAGIRKVVAGTKEVAGKVTGNHDLKERAALERLEADRRLQSIKAAHKLPHHHRGQQKHRKDIIQHTQDLPNNPLDEHLHREAQENTSGDSPSESQPSKDVPHYLYRDLEKAQRQLREHSEELDERDDARRRAHLHRQEELHENVQVDPVKDVTHDWKNGIVYPKDGETIQTSACTGHLIPLGRSEKSRRVEGLEAQSMAVELCSAIRKVILWIIPQFRLLM
ncbi:hypothetical protein BZG36_03456, partial [Bifiguratus adelaidae]